MQKRALKVGAFIVIAHAIAPLIAGLLNTSDPRGPVIYPRDYHDIAHTIGEGLAGRGRNKEPFAERPLFYGMKGKPIDREQLLRRLQEDAERRREMKNTERE